MFDVSFTIGLIAVVLLNIGMLPQIIRIIKYKDSQALSLLNLYAMCFGLAIMFFKAGFDDNTFFVINYGVALVLEVVLLFVTHLYRR